MLVGLFRYRRFSFDLGERFLSSFVTFIDRTRLAFGHGDLRRPTEQSDSFRQVSQRHEHLGECRTTSTDRL